MSLLRRVVKEREDKEKRAEQRDVLGNPLPERNRIEMRAFSPYMEATAEEALKDREMLASVIRAAIRRYFKRSDR